MMNDNPYDKAHELARAIKNSETYQHYLGAKKQLQQYPEMEEKMGHFRSLQMEINQAHILNQEIPNDKVAQAALQYAELNRNKIIAEFLNAEGLFVQMFTDIQQIIQKNIEGGLSE